MKNTSQPLSRVPGLFALLACMTLGPVSLLGNNSPVTDTTPVRIRPQATMARLRLPGMQVDVTPPTFKINSFKQLKLDAQNMKRLIPASHLITVDKTNTGNAVHKSGIMFSSRELEEKNTRSSVYIHNAVLEPYMMRGIQGGYPMPVAQFTGFYNGSLNVSPHITLQIMDLPTTARLYLVTLASTMDPASLRVEAMNADGSWKHQFSGADLISSSEGTEIRFMVPFPKVVAGPKNEFSLILLFYYTTPQPYKSYTFFGHLQWIQLD